MYVDSCLTGFVYFAEKARQVAVGIRAHYEIDKTLLFQESGAQALGHAAEHTEPNGGRNRSVAVRRNLPAGAFAPLEIPQAATHLLLCVLPDGARVQKNHIRLFLIPGKPEPVLPEHGRHDLGIRDIHLAPVGLDIHPAMPLGFDSGRTRLVELFAGVGVGRFARVVQNLDIGNQMHGRFRQGQYGRYGRKKTTERSNAETEGWFGQRLRKGGGVLPDSTRFHPLRDILADQIELQIDSTARLPGLRTGQRTRMWDDRYRKGLFVKPRHGERNAVHGDGSGGNKQVRTGRIECNTAQKTVGQAFDGYNRPDPVHMPLHNMPVETMVRLQGAFEVDAAAGNQCTEGGFGKGFLDRCGLERSIPDLGYGQANTVDRHTLIDPEFAGE